MFIVAWEGKAPPDKAEWTEILREVLAGELGSYRVVFRNNGRGWRFDLEWRDDGRANGDGEVIANSPDSVAYNIYVNLAGSGKPLDAGWRPWEHAPEAPAAVSAAAVPPAAVAQAAVVEAVVAQAAVAPAAVAPAAATDGSSSRAERPNRPASGKRRRRGR
jgi:hypothetical protein